MKKGKEALQHEEKTQTVPRKLNQIGRKESPEGKKGPKRNRS